MFACLRREPAGGGPAGVLDAIARACSPRVACLGADAVVFDVGGLSGILGAPADIAREVMRLAEGHGLVDVRLAIAGTMTVAWLLARATPGVTVVPGDAGTQAAAVSRLALSWLAALPDFGTPHSDRAAALGPRGSRRPPRRRARGRHFRLAPGPEAGVFGAAPPPLLPDVEAHLATLARWGLRTLGDVARLPRADLHARMGAPGVRLHQAARGEDPAPLVPDAEARRFVERLELDWPVDGLEPLSFVLARLCDALSASLERADRGAVGVTTRLTLVTREVHARALALPAPMRDARVLRTLVLLDLESHPPPAGIDVVEVEADVAPGRIVQGSLLARTLPSTEELATLLARLGALAGEGRVGAPARVDTHDDRVVSMTSFAPVERDAVPPGRAAPGDVSAPPRGRAPRLACRRFRLPVAVRVVVHRGLPARVLPAARGLPGGDVVAAAGPWRSSGHWWALDRTAWDRDEWDVEVAGGHLYRLSRDRASGGWVIEGAVD
jgi:protein ImuB